MKVRAARIFAAGFMLVFFLAVTWPGMIPFNRIEPRILGLPFSMAWIALWLVLACLALLVVHGIERGGRGP